jgi:hypothetical protein
MKKDYGSFAIVFSQREERLSQTSDSLFDSGKSARPGAEPLPVPRRPKTRLAVLGQGSVARCPHGRGDPCGKLLAPTQPSGRGNPSHAGACPSLCKVCVALDCKDGRTMPASPHCHSASATVRSALAAGGSKVWSALSIVSLSQVLVRA